MAVYLELISSPITNFGNLGGQGQGRKRAGAGVARRPVRGIEIKPDTYAMMKVLLADGTPLPLFDQSKFDGTGDETTSFLLQSAQESRMEKHQIIETFGDAYIFFFGEHPRFIDYTAVLLNSNDFNWEAEFDANYDKYYRGTKLVELGARLYLFYDDTIVEGYMMNVQKMKSSGEPNSVQIQFKVFLTGQSNVSLVGTPDYPISDLALAALGSQSSNITDANVDPETFLKNIWEIAGVGAGSDNFLKYNTWQKPIHALRSQIYDNYDEYIKSYDYGDPPKIKESETTDTYSDPNDLTDTPPEEVCEQINELDAETDEPGFFDKLGNCFSSNENGFGFDPSRGFPGLGQGFGTGPGAFNGNSLSPSQAWKKLKKGYQQASKVANDAAPYFKKGGIEKAANDAYKAAVKAAENAPVTINGKKTTVGKAYDSTSEYVTRVKESYKQNDPINALASAAAIPSEAALALLGDKQAKKDLKKSTRRAGNVASFATVVANKK